MKAMLELCQSVTSTVGSLLFPQAAYYAMICKDYILSSKDYVLSLLTWILPDYDDSKNSFLSLTLLLNLLRSPLTCQTLSQRKKKKNSPGG